MTVTEHLLTCLGEEGSEIAQDTCKCNRFGVDDVNIEAPDSPTNRYRLVQELNDLLAVARMLVDLGVLPENWQSPARQSEKRKRVLKFMDYAIKTGALARPSWEALRPRLTEREW